MGIREMKYIKLFEKSSFNDLKIPQKFLHFLHTEVPIKSEDFSISKLQRIPNSNILPRISDMKPNEAYLFISALNSYLFVISKGRNISLYTYIDEELGKKQNVTSYSKALGKDLFKHIVNKSEVYKVTLPEYEEKYNNPWEEFINVYGDFITKLVRKYAKELHKETLDKINKYTKLEDSYDTEYFEKLYKSLSRLNNIYKSTENWIKSAVVATVVDSVKYTSFEEMDKEKEKIFFDILNAVFSDSGKKTCLHTQKRMRKDILKEPSSYSKYKDKLKDPDILKELDWLVRGTKTDLWSMKTEMKYLKYFESKKIKYKYLPTDIEKSLKQFIINWLKEHNTIERIKKVTPEEMEDKKFNAYDIWDDVIFGDIQYNDPDNFNRACDDFLGTYHTPPTSRNSMTKILDELYKKYQIPRLLGNTLADLIEEDPNFYDKLVGKGFEDGTVELPDYIRRSKSTGLL